MKNLVLMKYRECLAQKLMKLGNDVLRKVTFLFYGFLVADGYVNSYCLNILNDYNGPRMLVQAVMLLTCIQECLVRNLA